MDASLPDILDEFRNRAGKGVAWVKALEWIASRLGMPIPENELKLAIIRHGAFLMDDGDWSVRLKAPLFLGRPFIVLPTAFELERGIFMPGGNLLPFLPFDIHPSGAEFKSRGRALALLPCELPDDELEKRYASFGREEGAVLIGIDDCEAEALDAPVPASDRLTRTRVFEASSLYGDPEFSPELGLRLRMTRPGCFEIGPLLRGDAPRKAERRRCQQILATAFDRVFSFFGNELGMDGQIAQAYSFAFGDEWPDIVPAFSEFLESDLAPSIASFGMDTRLVPRGMDAEASGDRADPGHPDPNGRAANRILASMGLPLRAPEIEALIRSLPRPAPDEAMEKLREVFPESAAFSKRPELLAALEGLAAYVRGRGNPFQEARIAPLRERALGCLLRSLSASMRLRREAAPTRENELDFLSVDQLIAELRGIIEFLNAPSPLGDERLSELSRSIGEVGAALEIYLSPRQASSRGPDEEEFGDGSFAPRQPALASRARASARPTAARAPRTAPPDRDTFILSLSVAGLKPSVSRVVTIPGTASLAFLSRCILTAFSWSGRRLHCFRVDDRIYGKIDANSLPMEQDEALECLGGLGLSPGDRFEYEYDFGSSWIVSISVSDKAPGERGAKPACLSGRGAAPPEDCGGPLAYSRLVGVWKAGASAEYDELRSRAGPDWDPDEFEPEPVNAALAALPPGQGGRKW